MQTLNCVVKLLSIFMNESFVNEAHIEYIQLSWSVSRLLNEHHLNISIELFYDSYFLPLNLHGSCCCKNDFFFRIS